MKQTIKNRCQGTPEIVDHELARVGIMATGHRHIDIPNFWAVMKLNTLPMFSPKALYLGMRQTWLKRERKND